MTDNIVDDLKLKPDDGQSIEDFIIEHMGCEPTPGCGINLGVMLYLPPEKTKGGIYLTDKIRDQYRFSACSGLVVSMGPYCYTVPESYYTKGPWCKLGDWVIIPRNEGCQTNYRGKSLMYIADNRILDTLEDPRYVKRD